MISFVRRWYALRDAAGMLSLTPAALRKQMERKAQRSPDGIVEAKLDGVRGRKFAGRWRVSFDKSWTE